MKLHLCPPIPLSDNSALPVSFPEMRGLALNFEKSPQLMKATGPHKKSKIIPLPAQPSILEMSLDFEKVTVLLKFEERKKI